MRLLTPSREVPEELMDVSNNGFRAIHSDPWLQPREVRFQHLLRGPSGGGLDPTGRRAAPERFPGGPEASRFHSRAPQRTPDARSTWNHIRRHRKQYRTPPSAESLGLVREGAGDASAFIP